MTVKTKIYTDAKEALNDYKYDSYEDLVTCEEIIKRIESCNFKNQRENADIINEIVVWKSNRRQNVGNALVLKIKELSKDLTNYNKVANYKDKIAETYDELTRSKGVSAAMASTILKMFMPEALPIIDQRAYREIYKGEEMPAKINGVEYLKYVDRVIEQFKEERGVNFSDMDKVLYQRDKAKGNSVKR